MRRIALFTLEIIMLILLLITMAFAVFVTPAFGHTRTQSIATPTAPVWYFAEGRVGAGFLQWITVSNPNNVNCAVQINYYYTMDGSTTGKIASVPITIPALTRHTESANADLNIAQNAATGATLSATVGASGCPGVVAERPMYFDNFHVVSAGTDVFGATSPQTDYYFADVPTGAAGESFLSIFNPNATNVNVSVTYFQNGTLITQGPNIVAPNSRYTFQPNGAGLSQQHVAVHVHSDQPIVAERPTYYVSVNGAYGSADVMGVTTPATAWSFAAGETTTNSTEVLSLANFNATATTATVKLMSSAGTSNVLSPVTIPANSSVQVDVNAANTFSGHTAGVALSVTGTQPIVAQRELYGNYDSSNESWSENGVSDAVGTSAQSSLYSFAEGFVSTGFNEKLYLLNTSTVDQQVTITLTNMLSQQDTRTITVAAGSQGVVDITSMVKSSTVFTLSNVQAYAVSMTVSSTGPITAERAMYWNAFATQGTDVSAGYAVLAAV